MDESLKQQILAIDLLRPHSIYSSNCSYLLRKEKKIKHNFVITQLLVFSLPFTSLAWDTGSHYLSSLLGLPFSPFQNRPLAFAGQAFNCRMVEFLNAILYQPH